jgi:chemotaxis signal transduction protein
VSAQSIKDWSINDNSDRENLHRKSNGIGQDCNERNKPGKVSVFSLAAEEHGIGVLKVKEIIGIMAITPMPRMPAYVQGAINLCV